MTYIERDFKEAYVRMKEKALELEHELAHTKRLLAKAVSEYPVESGIWVDRDGQAGYGSLKEMRLYLGLQPRTPQESSSE